MVKKFEHVKYHDLKIEPLIARRVLEMGFESHCLKLDRKKLIKKSQDATF